MVQCLKKSFREHFLHAKPISLWPWRTPSNTDSRRLGVNMSSTQFVPQNSLFGTTAAYLTQFCNFERNYSIFRQKHPLAGPCTLPMCDVISPCENSWSHLLLYQIEWNVGHKQLGPPASQIYKHPNNHHKWCCSVRFYGICKLMNMNLRSSDHDLKIKFGTFCRRRPNISPVTGVRKNLFGTLSTEKSLEFGQKPNRGRLSGSPHPFITIDHMMKWKKYISIRQDWPQWTSLESPFNLFLFLLRCPRTRHCLNIFWEVFASCWWGWWVLA